MDEAISVSDHGSIRRLDTLGAIQAHARQNAEARAASRLARRELRRWTEEQRRKNWSTAT